MTKTVLIAPVGYYENRLWKSILNSGAGKVYLINANGPLNPVTEYLSKKSFLPSKLGQIQEFDYKESADFSNPTSVYEIFIKIIETELSIDKNTKIIVDITSTTKDAAIAALLISRLYDVEISYVPPTKKPMEPQEVLKSPVKFLGKVKDERNDLGGKYLRYKINANPLNEDERLALRKIYEKGYNSITSLINDIGKKEGKSSENSGFHRYWSRIVHRLEDIGLVKIVRKEKKTKCPALTDLGTALSSGIEKAGI